MPFQIVCIRGEAVPSQVDIDETIELGRDPNCDVRLIDSDCSRFHARVSPNGSGVTLEDRKSSNGTFIGADRVTTQHLQDGDIFRCGAVAFAVVDLAAAGTRTNVVSDAGVALQVTRSQPAVPWKAGDDPTLLAEVHRLCATLARTEEIRQRAALISKKT